MLRGCMAVNLARMGRQRRWAIGAVLAAVALVGGIAVAVGADNGGPTVKERAQRDLDKVLEVRDLGKAEGLSLWAESKATGIAPVQALPDEKACQDRWDELGLSEKYGEDVSYQFVRACQDEPPKQMTG